MGVLASADNPRQPRSVGVLQMEEAAILRKKHSRRVHLWLCFVFSCLLLRGLDMERQHISRSYMGFLSAITLAVCLADMSASPLRSYPA